MELSSRQIVALGAPLIVTYLTWSAVGGEVAPLPASSGAAIATASASKRPQIGALARNPFKPAAEAGDEDVLIGREGESNDPAHAPLKLDGTVVTGRWRMAIINGERVFEGQSFRGRLRLEKVTSDSVTLIPASGEPMRLQLDIAPPQVPPTSAKNGAPKGSNAAAAKRGAAPNKKEGTNEAARGATAKKSEHTPPQAQHGRTGGTSAHGSTAVTGARY